MGSRHGLEIRAAAPSDAAGIAGVLAAAGAPVPAADLAARIEAVSGVVLLALEWGPPSGLVALHWHRTLLQPRPVARIDLLLVDPDARRRGLGRMLLKAGAQAARQAGCDAISLQVEPDQAALAAFCAATGFAPAGRTLVRSLRKGAREGGRAEAGD